MRQPYTALKEEKLRSIVASSVSWESAEIKTREILGAPFVEAARIVALNARGPQWLGESEQPHAPVGPTSQYAAQLNFYKMLVTRTPQVMWVVLALVVVALCPPFYQQIPGGFTINLGYGFLFSPPRYGSGLVGLVQVPLYATQLSVVVSIGLAVVWYQPRRA